MTSALSGLLEEARRRRGVTQQQLAELAGVSQDAVKNLLEAPASIRGDKVTIKALSKALAVDAWLLERAAASSGENIDEFVGLLDRASGGRLKALRTLSDAARPDSIEEAILMVRSSLTPDRQLELVQMIGLFNKLEMADRQLLLAIAARMDESS